jgi:hypothetical protein
MDSRRTLGYRYEVEGMMHTVEVAHVLDRRVAGEMTEQPPRGEGHSRCARDHAPWSLAYTGAVVCLLMGLSSPSFLEALQRVAVVKGAQVESHAQTQSLVDGGLGAPTAAEVRVLRFDDLLDAVEVQ